MRSEIEHSYHKLDTSARLFKFVYQFLLDTNQHAIIFAYNWVYENRDHIFFISYYLFTVIVKIILVFPLYFQFLLGC